MGYTNAYASDNERAFVQEDIPTNTPNGSEAAQFVYGLIELPGEIMDTSDPVINPKKAELYFYQERPEEESTNWLLRLKDGKFDTLSTSLPKDMLAECSLDGRLLILYDRGGGRVFHFDLENRTLERKDQSFNHQNFYKHTSFIDDANNIYLFGGYGFWQHKRLFIKFDMQEKEWVLEGQKQLDNLISENLLFDLGKQKGLLRMEKEGNGIIDVYKSPKSEIEWTYLESIRFTNVLQFGLHTYSIDHDQHFIFVANAGHSFGYDYKNQKAYVRRYNKPFDTYINYVRSAKYVPFLKKWALFCVSNYNNKKYVLRLMSSDELLSKTSLQQIDSFKRIELLESVRLRDWVLLSLLLVAVVYIFYLHRKGASNTNTFSQAELKQNDYSEVEDENSEHSLNKKSILEIRKHENGLPIYVKFDGKEEFVVSDIQESNLWILMHEMMQQNQKVIPQADFDERLFNGSYDASQISKQRKKLLDHANQRAGYQIIVSEKNPLDKRYRQIRLFNNHT